MQLLSACNTHYHYYMDVKTFQGMHDHPLIPCFIAESIEKGLAAHSVCKAGLGETYTSTIHVASFLHTLHTVEFSCSVIPLGGTVDGSKLLLRNVPTC